MIKYVLFDVMGVVFTVGDDVEGLLIPYVRSLKLDISEKSIKDAYHSASLGRITSRELWEQIGVNKIDVAEVERDYLIRSFTLDAGFLPCASTLKTRYGLALLSNDVSEWSKHLRVRYGIEPLIDTAFISGDLGVRKPDPKIYQIALDSLGAKSSECVFVDDSPERIEAARELGICSILFNREGHDYHGLRVRTFSQLTQLLV